VSEREILTSFDEFETYLRGERVGGSEVDGKILTGSFEED
jgi:hypothetical protein